FVAFKPGDDFDLNTVVAADGDGQKGGLTVFYGRNPQSFRAEKQRVHGQQESGTGRGQLEMNFGIRTGKQLPCGIIYVNFREQGAAVLVNGVRGANQSAFKRMIGKFIQHQFSLQTGLGSARIDFGNVHIDAQFVGRDDMEEFSARTAAGSGINERADVGVAGGDDSGEGRVNFLE